MDQTIIDSSKETEDRNHKHIADLTSELADKDRAIRRLGNEKHKSSEQRQNRDDASGMLSIHPENKKG